MSDFSDRVFGGGYYGKDGKWVRTKYCFVACPKHRCTCTPPNGQHYSAAHDKSKESLYVNGTEGKK